MSGEIVSSILYVAKVEHIPKQNCSRTVAMGAARGVPDGGQLYFRRLEIMSVYSRPLVFSSYPRAVPFPTERVKSQEQNYPLALVA